MATPTVYVICDKNCKFEGMTKEQILTAITQAVNNGSIGNIDTGFITTVKTITGTPLKFFVGEQSEYEALTESDRKNLFAIITNDATKYGLLKALEETQTELEELQDKSYSLKSSIALTVPSSNSSSLAAASVTLENGKTYIVEMIRNGANMACVFLLHIPQNSSDRTFSTVGYYHSGLSGGDVRLKYDMNAKKIYLYKRPDDTNTWVNYTDGSSSKTFTLNFREMY